MSEPKLRSTQANRLMWKLLRDVADQVVWHGQKLSDEDWKHVLSAGLKKQRIVPNIENDGFVVLGISTSKMEAAEFAQMIELIQMFGAREGVKFTAPEYMEPA